MYWSAGRPLLRAVNFLRFGGSCHSFYLCCLFHLHTGTFKVTFFHLSPFASLNFLHFLSLRGKNLPGVPSLDLNSGRSYSRPAHYLPSELRCTQNFWSSKTWIRIGSGSVFGPKMLDPDPESMNPDPTVGKWLFICVGRPASPLVGRWQSLTAATMWRTTTTRATRREKAKISTPAWWRGSETRPKVGGKSICKKPWRFCLLSFFFFLLSIVSKLS